MLLTMAPAWGCASKKATNHEVGAAASRNWVSLRRADHSGRHVQPTKYVCANVARKKKKKKNMAATANLHAPMPVFGDKRQPACTSPKLWKGPATACFSSAKGPTPTSPRQPAGTSAGLRKHARPSFLAFTNPATNSLQAPVRLRSAVNLVYSQGNRSAAVRIPLGAATGGKQPRIPQR